MRCLVLILLLATHATWAADVPRVVGSLMAEQNELRQVPFSDVVSAATGRKVLPLNPAQASDKELLGKISAAMDRVLQKLNATNGPAQQKRRINEVSALFE